MSAAQEMEQAQEAPAEQLQPKRLNLFERCLSLWVGSFSVLLLGCQGPLSEPRESGPMPLVRPVHLDGHRGAVRALALSPDGKSLASAGEDQQVKIWDPATGKLRWSLAVEAKGRARPEPILTGHKNSLFALSYSPDGKLLATAGGGTGKLWEAATGKEKGTIHRPLGVWSVEFAPDGRTVAVPGNGGIDLWDVEPLRKRRTLTPEKSVCMRTFFADSGRVLIGGVLTGEKRGTPLAVWDIPAATKADRPRLRDHRDVRPELSEWRQGMRSCICAAVAVVLCGGVGWADEKSPIDTDKRQQQELPAAFRMIQQSRTSKLVRVMGSQAWKHGGRVDAVAVSPDGKKAISGGLDGAVHLWDLTTGECLRTLAARSPWVVDLAFFPDGKSVLVARVNGRLDVLDVASGAATQGIDAGTQSLRRAAIFPDGKRVVAAPHKYPLSIFNVADQKSLATLGSSEEQHQISSLAITPDGKRVLVGTGKTLDVHDVDSGKRIRSIEGFKSYVASIAVARDGKRCLAGSGDGMVHLFDLESGKQLRVIQAHTIRIEAIAFTHGDERVFTGSDDYQFALFDLKDGKQVWRRHGPAVSCVAVTPDGKGAFTGSIHHGVMLWDLETGAARGQLSGHEMEVTSLAFVGDQTVTGSSDGTIRFWGKNGREARKLVRGYGGAEFVAAQDAKVLAISDRARGIVWFDLGTTEEKALPGSQAARALGTGPDGKTIVGLSNRVLKEWDLATGAAPREVAQLANSPNFAQAVESRAKVAVVYSGDARSARGLGSGDGQGDEDAREHRKVQRAARDLGGWDARCDGRGQPDGALGSRDR